MNEAANTDALELDKLDMPKSGDKVFCPSEHMQYVDVDNPVGLPGIGALPQIENYHGGVGMYDEDSDGDFVDEDSDFEMLQDANASW